MSTLKRFEYQFTFDTKECIAPGAEFMLVSEPSKVLRFVPSRMLGAGIAEDKSRHDDGFEARLQPPQYDVRLGETMTLVGKNTSKLPLHIVVTIFGPAAGEFPS